MDQLAFKQQSAIQRRVYFCTT